MTGKHPAVPDEGVRKVDETPAGTTGPDAAGTGSTNEQSTSPAARTDRPVAGGQSRRPPASAKDGDPRKIEENRKRMGVGNDHRTEAMRKGGRGTFP